MSIHLLPTLVQIVHLTYPIPQVCQFWSNRALPFLSLKIQQLPRSLMIGYEEESESPLLNEDP